MWREEKLRGEVSSQATYNLPTSRKYLYNPLKVWYLRVDVVFFAKDVNYHIKWNKSTRVAKRYRRYPGKKRVDVVILYTITLCN